MPYYPPVTKRLVPAFRKHNIDFMPKSVKTVRSLLGSTKDPIPFLEKSGIYEIFCQSAVYYNYYNC